MIAELEAKIAAAEAEIKELREIKIPEAEEELEKCRELLPLLKNIGTDASNGEYALNNAANSLNKGIRIDGVGQGQKISERAVKIKELHTNSETGAGNVQKRITELEQKIEEWNARIVELEASIEGWRAEIARIQAEERARKEAMKKAINIVADAYNNFLKS